MGSNQNKEGKTAGTDSPTVERLLPHDLKESRRSMTETRPDNEADLAPQFPSIDDMLPAASRVISGIGTVNTSRSHWPKVPTQQLMVGLERKKLEEVVYQGRSLVSQTHPMVAGASLVHFEPPPRWALKAECAGKIRKC